MELYITLGILAILVIYLIATYNGMIKMRNSLKEAFATMDVYLKKRWDLIPNLVETVKGYAKHEKETFAEVVNLRNGKDYSAMSDEEKMQVSGEMSKAVAKFFALAENYPELKASTNFLDLQRQLKSLEDDIANARKYYNAVVKHFNNKIQVFPNSIFASIFGFSEATSFEAPAAERENVKVEF